VVAAFGLALSAASVVAEACAGAALTGAAAALLVLLALLAVAGLPIAVGGGVRAGVGPTSTALAVAPSRKALKEASRCYFATDDGCGVGDGLERLPLAEVWHLR
jgi:hypothetical protein